MSKEELKNEYQNLLEEYQKAETERRENLNEIKKIKEQKDIEEQKIEYEEAKEKFEPGAEVSTEELIQRAKSRQEKLNKIEEKILEAEEKNKKLLTKKEEIRNSAKECYSKSLNNKEELNNLIALKEEKEKEVESKSAKIDEWSHKENRTTEEYIKIGNELKESIIDLNKTEESIKAEKERLEKYSEMEIKGAEILYKSFINGANRIDEGKTIVLDRKHEKESNEENNKKQERTAPNLIVGNEKGSIEFTPEELESFKENVTSGPKQEQKDVTGNKLENIEDKEKNSSVRILYSAKTDKYIVTNINTNEQKVVSRKDLEKLDKNILAEKMGKDLDNVDTNILQLLLSYDEQYKTHKASEYIETISTIGINKKQRQNAMKESQIDIEYNLKGLYDKKEIELYEYEDIFSKEEKEELLSIANNAKIKGIATIKKGFKVSFMEVLNKVARKFSSNKLLKDKKVSELPEARKDSKNETQYQRVNQKYWDSIKKSEYKKGLKEAQEEKEFKEKIKVEPKEIQDNANINETIEKMNKAAQEKIQELEK